MSSETDLTKVQNQCSLTNWVELIRVDDICKRTASKFEMVRWKNPPETLQHLFAALGVFRESYNLYEILPIYVIMHDFKLNTVGFDDLSKRKSVYFAIKKTITCRVSDMHKLTHALFNIWIQNAGTAIPASVWNTAIPEEYPIVMPSRFVYY